MTIFLSPLGTSHRPPTPPPPAMLCPKKAVIPPICSKFNFVWSVRGGIASFTNITEKVAALLTSSCSLYSGKGTLFLGPKTQIQPPFRGHIHVCSTQKVTEGPL